MSEIRDLQPPFYFDENGKIDYVVRCAQSLFLAGLFLTRKQWNGLLVIVSNASWGTLFAISGHIDILQSMARIRPPTSGDSYHISYFLPIALIGGPILFGLISVGTLVAMLPWPPKSEA
ncbi:MAG: hypothetical protein JNK63_03475 [Chthonomonas sp.]|nr:hypothetical protein [Chthonomonas sp.]